MKSNNYSLDLKLRVVESYNERIFTVAELTKIFKVSKSSVYNWVAMYNNNLLTNKQSYTKPSAKFNNIEIRKIIFNYIQTNPNFIYFVLIEHIFTTTKIKIKKSTLYNIIHDLRFSKKVAKFKKNMVIPSH